jgi:hypothetical protein
VRLTLGTWLDSGFRGSGFLFNLVGFHLDLNLNLLRLLGRLLFHRHEHELLHVGLALPAEQTILQPLTFGCDRDGRESDASDDQKQ